jgi:hypothetical protein
VKGVLPHHWVVVVAAKLEVFGLPGPGGGGHDQW